MASKKGYTIFAGGAAGARPKIGEKLIENASEQEVIDILGKIIDLYQKDAKTPERLGIFMERIGSERFKKEIITTQGDRL